MIREYETEEPRLMHDKSGKNNIVDRELNHTPDGSDDQT